MGLQDNKSPWAIGAPIDTNRTPSLDEIVDRRFATQYLAQRLPLPYGDIRQFRDRIGKKIDTAFGNGQLKSINGKCFFGDLATWGRSRPDLAAAVADVAIPTTGTAHMVAPSMFVRALGFSIPPSLTDCQAALADAYRELSSLREENNALRATVAVLTPLKERAEAKSKATRRAGRKGGRPPKK